jgi:outer membrane protein assembly factor BamB
VTPELVIVGADGPPMGWLYALERSSGRLRWKHPFLRGVSSQVLESDGLAIAVGGAGEVAAFEIATGKMAWYYEQAPPGEREWAREDSALAGELVIVPWPNGDVLALDRRSGERRWTTATGAAIMTSVAVAGDSVWVGAMDGRLRKLEVGSGRVLAVAEAAGRLYGDLQVASGCLLALAAGGDAHSLTCHDPASGAVRWRHPVDEEVSTFRPLIHENEVIFGTKGTLFALSLADGSERWHCSIAGVPRGLSAAGNQLFVGTLGGTISALPEAACAGSSVPQRHPEAPRPPQPRAAGRPTRTSARSSWRQQPRHAVSLGRVYPIHNLNAYPSIERFKTT